MHSQRVLLFVMAMLATVAWAQSPEDVSRPRPADVVGQSSTADRPVPASPAAPASPQAAKPPDASGFKRVETAPVETYSVAPGTRVLLSMINSVSTKQAAVGDRIYLETAFPVLEGNRILIPQGSWVQGTVTEVKRPGRVKGRGALHVRFDSLTLPNGVTRDFRARIGSMDGRSTEQLDKNEGKIKAPGNKGGDAQTVADTTITGAGVGAIAGAAAGSLGKGAGIGAVAGAGAGLIGVLLSRGPDAMLTKGTTMEMVLDRSLTFSAADLDFSHVPPRAPLPDASGPLEPSARRSRRRGIRPPFPL